MMRTSERKVIEIWRKSKMENAKIKNLYNLEETIAGEYLSQFERLKTLPTEPTLPQSFYH